MTDRLSMWWSIAAAGFLLWAAFLGSKFFLILAVIAIALTVRAFVNERKQALT